MSVAARPAAVARIPLRDRIAGAGHAGPDHRGIPLTLQIGLIAGTIGLGIGTILGFVAGYIGGVVDTVIRSAADIMLTVPGLLVLIVVAASIEGLVSVDASIAFVVASLGLDVADADDPLAGALPARAALRRDGEAQRDEHARRSSARS